MNLTISHTLPQFVPHNKELRIRPHIQVSDEFRRLHDKKMYDMFGGERVDILNVGNYTLVSPWMHHTIQQHRRRMEREMERTMFGLGALY